MRCWIIQVFFATPRRTLWWIAIALTGMLVFGLYLQNAVGLRPCPMCIVQRYCMVVIALTAFAGALTSSRKIHAFSLALIGLIACGGAFVAGRQSWLQWYPPEVVNCGRDFYGMIEQLPLSHAMPQIFSGNGDCSQVDWTFLGASIANWSFLCFTLLIIMSSGWLVTLYKRSRKKLALFP